MDGLGDRVKAERERLGLSQEQLAKAVTDAGYEIGQSGIGNIESHRSKNPKCISELATVLGVTVSWLRTGRGPKQIVVANANLPTGAVDNRGFQQSEAIKSNVHELDARQVLPLRSEMPKDVPVLGTVSGGSGGVHMVGEAIDWVRRPPKLDGRKDVFALYVEDVSMVPAFGPGDLILVDGLRPARPGDHIVIEFKDTAHHEHKAILKKLTASTPTKIRLEQYNPPKTIEVPRASIVRMRRVMTMMDLFGV